MPSIAVLPMYDRPELRQQTDNLWYCIRDELRLRGIDAPDGLDREVDVYAAWLDDRLVLGQTCGLPFKRRLNHVVQLLGAPHYGIDGCKPGYYRSVWIVRNSDPRRNVPAFLNARLAFNSRDSQSGYAAAIEDVGAEFAEEIATGAHTKSLMAVASGTADIAAIDAVTWRYAQAFEPCVTRLRVLGKTRETPGLPFISSREFELETVRTAVKRGIDKLDETSRRALGIYDFVSLRPDDYNVRSC